MEVAGYVLVGRKTGNVLFSTPMGGVTAEKIFAKAREVYPSEKNFLLYRGGMYKVCRGLQK